MFGMELSRHFFIALKSKIHHFFFHLGTNEIYKQNGKYNDYDISQAKRQTLLHWGYELTLHDFSLNKN